MYCMARLVIAKSTALNNANPRYKWTGTCVVVNNNNDDDDALFFFCCLLYTKFLKMYANIVYPMNCIMARKSPSFRLHSSTLNSSCKYPYNKLKKNNAVAHTVNCVFRERWDISIPSTRTGSVMRSSKNSSSVGCPLLVLMVHTLVGADSKVLRVFVEAVLWNEEITAGPSPAVI